MARKRLGELLTDRRLIDAVDLELAMQEQARTNVRLGEVLLRSGVVKKPDLIAALQEVTRTKYVDCAKVKVTPEALALVRRELAERHTILPLWMDGGALHVVSAEPQNLMALDELRFAAGITVQAWLGFRSEIEQAIKTAYTVQDAGTNDSTPRVELISASATESNLAAMREFQAELFGAQTPAVRLVSTIIGEAAQKNASDIHIEQLLEEAIVRIRIDGVLREAMRVPATLRNPLISRIKILADMDIAERRVPQDGRFLARLGKVEIDLRVSTLPTQYGEKVVLRLLNSSTAAVPLEKLGIEASAAEQLYSLLSAPQGMVLVTGPTGSGKSTTLYSALNFIKSPSVNITTIEDPVEYVIPGVNQVQVNAKAGRNFAGCLRSMLRQDPNVVMLGEIRDGETAEIALTAAQTGHLVLSTLHTNDSIAAITRLIDLGVPPFLIASSVSRSHRAAAGAQAVRLPQSAARNRTLQ